MNFVKSYTVRFLNGLVMLFAVCLLAGCLGGGSSEPTRYYVVDVESINASGAGDATKSVQIRKFSIDPAYQRSNIVYRESAYTFMFYDLDLWASRPDQMLQKVATKYIEQSGLFAKGAKTAKPDFEILGNIDAIEEVDEGSSRYAHLDITLTFRKTEGAPLFEKEYDERIAMDGSEPEHVAKAISKLYGQFVDDFLKNVSQNMGE